MPRPVGDRIPELYTTNRADVGGILRTFTYREREIFKLRTGLPDGYCYTLAEVAHIFKVSESQISRIQKRARQKFLKAISQFSPRTTLDPQAVESVLQQAEELTPFLITHLRGHPEDLRLLPWQVFEQLIAEFFASWGYDEVKLLGRKANTAADVFVLKRIQPEGNDLRIFVETKRWKDHVGVEVVDRVYGAFLSEKSTFGWHMAMIVTLAGFAKMRKYSPESLRMLGISLKDENDVRTWLQDYRFGEKGLWLPQCDTGK